MTNKLDRIINQISFQQDDSYFEEIYPNIWIMDNHKWALYCWEQYRIKNKISSILVHLDYHWDAINDYFEDEFLVKNMDLNALYNEIKNNIIRCDSFISPAIIRGYIDKVGFHCFQTGTIGFDGDFLNRYNTTQNIHNNIEELVKEIGKQEIILDIDLDIFNTLGSRMGSVWCKEEIKTYINKINPLIKQAKIVTVAMSYNYASSNEDIEYLTKLVVPLIIKIKTLTEEENN
ncbi:uncharacterized protein UPF0489 [Malaciobacter marinus]|jgi:hypothetical protein|uniref:Uncharacterized protein UPF0489 n=1 Tax=Malaciobacter marinus TaxID=505249 RepID=A0AB36ZRH7_9BACT|nr:UPF0489 family protein [Malaciobacter marinus]PPK57337.1 uncharacterized protein UPF0489 [Malaciobacter marinus]